MTTVQLIIEDGTEDELKKVLHAASFKAEFVHKNFTDQVAEPQTQYQKLKKILDTAKGKDIFQDIEDPAEWQRQIRKEWDRDL